MTNPVRITVDRPSIPFEEEMRFTFARMPLSEDEAKDVKMIVNSEQYHSFREFLLKLACEQYIIGRTKQDWQTHAFNQLGDLLANVVAQLDSYRVKPDTSQPPDEYDA